MQLKNLSVAKKVWLLLGIVVVVLVGSSVFLQRFMSVLEADLRTEIQGLEARTRHVIQLRGGIEAGASTIVASAFAHDATTRKYFEAHFKTVQQGNAQLMQQLDAELVSPEARALLAQLMQTIVQADQQIAQLEQERKQGGDLGAFTRIHFTPTIDRAIELLEAMVKHQSDLLQLRLQDSDVQRTQGHVQVWLAFAVLALVSLVLARMLALQITAPLAQAVQLAHEIAEGNLTANVHDDRQDELGVLLRALQTMTLKLRALIGEVGQGVDSVSTASVQIEQGNANLAMRTEQTAANLQETAASLEELTATVTQSADTAQQANQLVHSAMQSAQRGGALADLVVQSMEQIHRSSQKISDIIGVIDGIAFQTNILALNAAVEAARAGEQGRGFAVVAGEVRNLAQRSAEAAKEIKALISDSVQSVEEGASHVQSAGQGMQELVQSVTRVNDLIAEISAAAHEQRDGIAQVNQAVGNLDQMTQQNAALVEESSAAASAMHVQAQRLRDQVSTFKTVNP